MVQLAPLIIIVAPCLGAGASPSAGCVAALFPVLAGSSAWAGGVAGLDGSGDPHGLLSREGGCEPRPCPCQRQPKARRAAIRDPRAHCRELG